MKFDELYKDILKEFKSDPDAYRLVAIDPNQGYLETYHLWDIYGNDMKDLKKLDGKIIGSGKFGGSKNDVESELSKMGYMYSYVGELKDKNNSHNKNPKTYKDVSKKEKEKEIKKAITVVKLHEGNY
jgi:hypothetical protein